MMQRDRQRRLNETRIRLRTRRLSGPRRASRRVRVRAIQRNIMRRIEDSEGIPTYDVDVTKVNGNIHTVTIVPITTGENNYSLEAAQATAAALIRTLVIDEVGNLTGWSKARVKRRVSGYIQVTNTMNPTSSHFFAFDKLREITQAKIDESYTSLQQSETETPFENVEFMIVINPSSFQVGAGSELSVKRGKGLGWQTYVDEQGPINCAAVALTLLVKKERFDQKIPLLKK